MSDLQVGILSILAAFAFVLIWHAMNRNSHVRRTRVGFFIERDKFEDEPLEVSLSGQEAWTDVPLPSKTTPDEQVTNVDWPDKGK